MVYGKRSYYVYRVSDIDDLAWALVNCSSLTMGFRLGSLVVLNDSARGSLTKKWAVLFDGCDLGHIESSGFDEAAIYSKLNWLLCHAQVLRKAAPMADLRVQMTERGDYGPAAERHHG
jgi:hypothetical protein